MGALSRRLLATLPVLLVVAAVIFLLVRLAPGDPAVQMAGDFATAADIAALRISLGLDQPVWWQFARWLGRLMTGDLGTSILTRVPVSRLLAQRLEPTASLALCTLLLTLVIAVPLGTVAAHRAGCWPDHAVTLLAVLAASMPVFMSGYLLVHAFSSRLGWFPVQGYSRFADGAGDWLRSIALPSASLALVYAALIMRITRATVLQQLRADYVRTARAKGLGTLAVSWHALRNAAIPITTTFGVGFAMLLGGVAVTESVFAIPGLGRLLVDAVQRRDYPVIQGVLLVAALSYVLVNLAVDLGHRRLDPRGRA